MKSISLNNLDKELTKILETYESDITNSTKSVVHEVSKNFKDNTKRDAPRGRRKKYYKYINIKNSESAFEATDIWYVKDPEYRLTHLIKNGHATRKGGRTKPNDFIDKNFDIAEKELSFKITERIKNGH